MSKIVYFGRHGESVANETGIRTGGESPLTGRGRAQAVELGKRLAGMGIERIDSSDMRRAHETASAVSSALRLPITTVSPLFAERRNPSIMLGSHVSDPSIVTMWEEMAAHYGETGWHHSDEENFDDLRERAKLALDTTLTCPEKCIFVASHGLFMKMILAEVLLGDHLTGRTFWDRFIPIKNIQNAGLMKLEYTMNFSKTRMVWKLHSWNDHAHLSGELAGDSRHMA